MTVTALLTCFNRRDQTQACLRHLFAQALPPHITVSAVIVDDGSSDGTSEAVRSEFPKTSLLQGDGSLYWCGGMRKAWTEAAADNPEFYFLLNDDTVLKPEAVKVLLDIAESPDSRVIAVAAIRDDRTGAWTYGGIRGASGAVTVSGSPETCDTFNANAALIPRAVYQEIGMFHEAYTHAMGDFDYGYEASRHGIRVIQSPGFLGTCRRNMTTGTWKDKTLSRGERFRRLQSPKGLPWKEWVLYNRRNSGCLWPYRCITPYLRIFLGL